MLFALADTPGPPLDAPVVGHSLFQFIFVPLCILLAVRAFYRTVRGRSSRKAGAAAIALWSLAGLAIAVPSLTLSVALMLGIHRGADLVLYLAILAGIGVCFYFYQRARRLETLITGLVRRDALRQAIRGRGDGASVGGDRPAAESNVAS